MSYSYIDYTMATATVPMPITVYACDTCNYHSTALSLAQRHVVASQRCMGASVIVVKVIAQRPMFRQTSEPVPQQRPGPKPIDYNATMRGRIAFHDDIETSNNLYAYTRRLAKTNTVAILDDIFSDQHSPQERLMQFFDHFWGCKAPPFFQSISRSTTKLYIVKQSSVDVVPFTKHGVTRHVLKYVAYYFKHFKQYVATARDIPPDVRLRCQETWHVLWPEGSDENQTVYRYLVARYDRMPRELRERIQTLADMLHTRLGDLPHVKTLNPLMSQ